jgi:hypothetical protein
MQTMIIVMNNNNDRYHDQLKNIQCKLHPYNIYNTQVKPYKLRVT